MPIYEFSCGACGADFERLQKIADPDPAACPACGAMGAVRRRISAPQFRLAGGGWYETDFKSDADKKRNLSGDGGAPKEPVPTSPAPAAEASAAPPKSSEPAPSKPAPAAPSAS
jgi:putative FmdB family regulatory protein